MELDLSKTLDMFASGHQRKDRTAVFSELTKSICPVCKRNLDAEIFVEKGKMYMKKSCQDHGRFKALILSDAQWYYNSLKFNKPGSVPLHFNSRVANGCPDDCGLCPNHQQHTCLGVLEITDSCNLHCNQCFADSAAEGSFMPVAEVKRRIENLIRCEGKIEVVQISGGEPTLHPQLVDIIELIKSYDVQSVMLNTNGIRIAQSPDFIERLSLVEPTKPSIYLQFDGFKDSFYKNYRGRPLLDTKLKAIERLSNHGFKVALVVTVIKGQNDDQIGKICEFAIKHEQIRSVNFQPVFYEGRSCGELDALDRITLTDIFAMAEEQTAGMLLKDDFVPVPCPFPSCSGLTYVYYEDGKATPITRLIDVEDYLDFISNRTMAHLSDDIFRALKSLFSFSVDSGSLSMVQDFCTACGLTLPRIDSIAERVTMIGSMAFMDAYTFDWKRAMKCCVHELVAEDKIVPFCVYNNIFRERQDFENGEHPRECPRNG